MMWKRGSLPYRLDPAGFVAFCFFSIGPWNPCGVSSEGYQGVKVFFWPFPIALRDRVRVRGQYE